MLRDAHQNNKSLASAIIYFYDMPNAAYVMTYLHQQQYMPHTHKLFQCQWLDSQTAHQLLLNPYYVQNLQQNKQTMHPPHPTHPTHPTHSHTQIRRHAQAHKEEFSLHVSDLAEAVTNDLLEKLFKSCQTYQDPHCILGAKIVVDHHTGRTKGTNYRHHQNKKNEGKKKKKKKKNRTIY